MHHPNQGRFIAQDDFSQQLFFLKSCHHSNENDSIPQETPQKTLWTTPPFGYYKDNLCAQIAQPVEQRTENPCVGGSNPSLGTRNFWAVVNFIFLVGVAITTLRRAEIG